ncbi:MAG: hypothetical protein KDA44_02365 [Planctomycetales bacterium]|nr:hypothetical protein [Planctomycetales bacterium]
MAMGSWWGKRTNRRGRSSIESGRLRKGPRRHEGRRLLVEELEDRRMLAVLTVLNPLDLDTGGNVVPGSLRQMINIANSNGEADTIVFSETALISTGGTIVLDGRNVGSELAITDNLTIAGSGARKISIVQGKNDTRVFNIDNGDDDNFINVTITGVTISGGNLIGTDEDADRGGAIYNKEVVTLNEVSIDGNSASMGGGGIYNKFGSVTINRSSVLNNSQGVLNGDPEEDEKTARTSISNSTFSGNSIGLTNQRGTVDIVQSTFAENGIGLNSQGNGLPELDDMGMPTGDPPQPVVFTNIEGSIFAYNSIYDLSTLGVEAGDGEDAPPRSSNPSIFSYGYNIWGDDPEMLDPRTMLDPLPTPADEGTIAEIDMPSTDRITDPFLLPLGNYGGSTDVYLPNNDPMNPDFGAISPAIDTGDPDAGGSFYEQRGRQFTRIFNMTGTMDPIIDVGAAEVQAGQFVVDTLQDDFDYQFSGFGSADYLDSQGNVGTPFFPAFRGDFSLREAILFSQLNPEVDTIEFSPLLLGEADPTASKAPTILLSLGELVLDHEVIIQGPKTFELEIDATGNDATPNLNNADGTRVFNIDNGITVDIPEFGIVAAIDVTINNLTIMGGDVIDRGGGIYNRENLFLNNSWVKDNAASNDGGGVFVQFGSLTVDSSTFSNNFAADDGGGIYFDIPTFGAVAPIVGTIVNSTITGNTAGDRGAGIGNFNGDVTIEHSTITLNSSASTRGSGVASMGGAFATTSVRSSIIAGNVNNDIEYVSGGSASDIVSLGYNIIGNGNAISEFIQTGDKIGVLNPMLDALKREGGPTPVQKPLAGSPAIDGGDPADVADGVSAPLYDQRGQLYTRVFDGDQDGTAVIDVGAYELQGVTYVVDTPLDENDGNIGVGFLSLREAIELANINPLPDVIMFDPAVLFDQTIYQSSASSLKPGTPADMRITDSVTIVGLGLDFLTIDLQAAYDDIDLAVPKKARLFTIDDGKAGSTIDVKIQDLRIANGFATGEDIFFEPIETMGPGGVINSKENLQIEGLYFVNNSTTGDGKYGGVIYQEGGSLTLGLSGLTGNSTTFTANSTDGVGANGGVLAAINANVLIQGDTSFSGNSTSQTASHGGAIYVQGGTLTVDESSVTGNVTADGASRGGGIYAVNATVDIVGSNISGNATAGANSEGGGLYEVASTVNFSNSNLSLNQSFGTSSEGAGIYANGGNVTFNNSRVAQNKTFGSGSSGAGVVATNGAVVDVYATAVSGNQTSGANAHGAGIQNLGAKVTVRDSLIDANQALAATANGGGIWNDANLAGSQYTTIVNSTVSTNLAGGRGGGIYNADGLTQLLHSTVVGNQANNGFYGYGGGIASFGTAATLTVVGSSIVAANLGSDVDQVLGSFANTFSSAGYNLVGSGLALGAFPTNDGDLPGTVDPVLGPLANNGGPTFTHAVLEGSPAINAGDPFFSSLAFSPTLDDDQRGADRVLQGRIDIGAYESNFTPPANADFDGGGIINGGDFLAWQRGYGITSGASKGQGDADLNGSVDGADLSAWQSQFGTTPAATVTVAAAVVGGGSDSSNLLADEALATPFDETTAASTTAPLLGANEWLLAPVVEKESANEVMAADAIYEQVGDDAQASAAASLTSTSFASHSSDISDEQSLTQVGAAEDWVFDEWGDESWGL